MAARVLATLVLVGAAVIAGIAAFGGASTGTTTVSSGAVSASADTEATSLASDSVDSTTQPASAPTVNAPPMLGAAGELTNLDGWLQSDISSLDELAGTVHVVQFWTFGCYNCKNTLPNLIELSERHADDDFTIVGVHAPEFDFEKDPDNIQSAATDLGVTWPIALDTSKTNFRSWQESRRFWPRTYVIDQNGEIRFDRIGEGAYSTLNETVAYLLDNPPA